MPIHAVVHRQPLLAALYRYGEGAAGGAEGKVADLRRAVGADAGVVEFADLAFLSCGQRDGARGVDGDGVGYRRRCCCCGG